MDEPTEQGAASHELESVLTKLCNAWGVCSREQFVDMLVTHQIEVVRLACNSYGLVRWIETGDGFTMEVLTATGAGPGLAELPLMSLERHAINGGAQAVVGIARWGWRPLLERMRYECGTKLFYFRKKL